MTKQSSHPIPIFINRTKYEIASETQTGRALKELAGIPVTDTLFLQQPGEDLVVANDVAIELRPGSHLFSQPPADYGRPSITADDLGVSIPFEVLPQADGWTFVVLRDFVLPADYSPACVSLLLKLPPLFPDAQPDMFWIAPPVRTASGGVPIGTGPEVLLGQEWQRFSWHLAPGAWKPGSSTLRDFMRCVRARLERGT